MDELAIALVDANMADPVATSLEEDKIACLQVVLADGLARLGLGNGGSGQGHAMLLKGHSRETRAVNS